jgi:CSLREA domain-containing protein
MDACRDFTSQFRDIMIVHKDPAGRVIHDGSTTPNELWSSPDHARIIWMPANCNDYFLLNPPEKVFDWRDAWNGGTWANSSFYDIIENTMAGDLNRTPYDITQIWNLQSQQTNDLFGLHAGADDVGQRVLNDYFNSWWPNDTNHAYGRLNAIWNDYVEDLNLVERTITANQSSPIITTTTSYAGGWATTPVTLTAVCSEAGSWPLGSLAISVVSPGPAGTPITTTSIITTPVNGVLSLNQVVAQNGDNLVTAVCTDAPGRMARWSTHVQYNGSAQTGPVFVVNSLADTNDGACTPPNVSVGNNDCTLREAINAANVYTGTPTIQYAVQGSTDITSSLPAISNSMSIIGPPNRTVVLGNFTGSVFVVDPGATLNLEGLVIGRGHATDGGGIYSQGTLNLTNVDMVNNGADNSGGAIFSTGPVTIISSTLRLNGVNSSYGGAVYAANGLTLHGVFIWDSLVLGQGGGGGAVWVNSGPTDVTDSDFRYNTANNIGGLVALGPLTLNNTNFVSNTTTGTSLGGGGVYAGDGITITGSVFQDNVGTDASNHGGALYVAAGGVMISGTQFLNNSTPLGRGGAVWVQSGNATVSNARFERGSSADGGGLVALGPLTLINTNFVSNTTTGSGNAGAVYAGGVVNVQGGLFQGNSTTGAGGGLYAASTLTVTAARFINNQAILQGGAIAQAGDDGSVVNTLLVGNRSDLHGSALYLGSTGHAQILFTTIASPTVDDGVAIFVNSGSVGITDTIITSHTIGIYNTGGTVYEDYDLFSGNTTNQINATGGTHDVHADPRFVDPSQGDYYLGVGSPAISAGVNANVFTTLDGLPRPLGNGFDIGAYEFVDPPQSGPTFVVNSLADSDDGACNLPNAGIGNRDCTLREAINAANVYTGTATIQLPGGTINIGLVPPLLFGPPLPPISNSMTIVGSPSGTYLSGLLAQARVLSVNPGVTLNLEKLWIEHGSAPDGGGIYSQGPLNLTDVNFFANAALNSGGAIYATGPVTMNGSDLVLYNQANTYYGGAVYAANGLSINHVIFVGNTAPGGGAVWVNGGATSAINSDFDGNTASNVGGLVALGPLALSNTNFVSNTTTGNSLGGGGVYAGNGAVIIAGIFQGNVGMDASNHGGALYVASGGTTISGTQFIGNQVPNGHGGAVLVNDGHHTVINATFSRNSAGSPITATQGGGLYDYGGALTIQNTTFVSNTAGGDGGGLFTNNGTVTVTNSTFYGNNSSQGGGISNLGSALTIINATLANNRASTSLGDDLRSATGSTSILENTIVANGPAVSDCLGTFIDGGGNVESGNSCGFSVANHSKPNTNLVPGPLADNGGSTWTMALPLTSPAVDAAVDANCPGTDQRGVARPQGPHCDSGTYEFVGKYLYLPLIQR